MEDREVIDRINALAREEHELFRKGSAGEITQAERERLRELEIALDRCWDLLRRRRARRAAGLDPEAVEMQAEIRTESSDERPGDAIGGFVG